MKKLYKVCILTYIKICFANSNNICIFTDFQTIIQFQEKTKTANYVKTQLANHADFEYKSRKKATKNKASS